MYTGKPGNGLTPSRGCTRSRHVKFAEEDLKFLNGLSTAPPVSTIFGRVTARTDDSAGKDQPLVGAKVEIRGPRGTRLATTDATGHYGFNSLPPETYTLTASSSGHRMLPFGTAAPTATVEPRACAEVNINMGHLWPGRIAGRVTQANGAPARPGLVLTLLQVRTSEGKEIADGPGRATTTNKQGEYSFNEVAPGRYKLVMNLHRFPIGDAPYPTIYWPGSRDEVGATAIVVPNAPVPQQYDFRLPPEQKRTQSGR